MIKNERQYRITQAQAQRLEEGLRLLASRPVDPSIHPRIRQAEEDGLRSQLEDLRKELEEYDRLRSGEVTSIEVHSWEDIPRALIQARIAAGLTQRELAERLGLKPQQIQQYEASEYLAASFQRIRQVAQALHLEFHGEGIFARA